MKLPQTFWNNAFWFVFGVGVVVNPIPTVVIVALMFLFQHNDRVKRLEEAHEQKRVARDA